MYTGAKMNTIVIKSQINGNYSIQLVANKVIFLYNGKQVEKMFVPRGIRNELLQLLYKGSQ